jgi:hypothetical protein
MSNRFEYVKYDEVATTQSNNFKNLFEQIENGLVAIGGTLGDAKGPVVGREVALVRTKLEEAYMWIGKALRNDQVQRDAISKSK